MSFGEPKPLSQFTKDIILACYILGAVVVIRKWIDDPAQMYILTVPGLCLFMGWLAYLFAGPKR